MQNKLNIYKSYFLSPEFRVERDEAKCIKCKVCVRQCSFGAHAYDAQADAVRADDNKCVGCNRCSVYCPTGALTIIQNPQQFKTNANWTPKHIKNIYRQAESGGVLVTGMGTDKPYPVYWDHLL